jgi:2-polyprenyl-3-methyl-5-hydroxy-6-metoxy-1,4-benzoquinol methylase
MSSPSSFRDIPLAKVSEYWNSRPCNIRHSPQPVGSREYFEEVEARKYFVEPHIPGFAEFERWRGKKVLEIGCGIGTDTIRFASCGAQVTAVDLTEKSLEVAQRRAEIFGLADRVRFVHANAEKLSEALPAEPYDLVYSFGVIHHTPNPESVLEEIRKYLGPSTTVKIMVYNRWSWKVLWILATYGKGRFWVLDRLVAEYSEAEEGCPVTYSYSRGAGRRLLEKHGLRVTGVSVDHIFPFSIPEYVQYQYKVVWYFRWMPKWLFRSLERAFGWHLCLTAKPQ